MRRSLLLIPVFLVAVLLFAVGCGKAPNASSAQGPSNAPPLAAAKSEGHEHQRGAHDGLIVEIGRDNYHAEVVFDKNGVIRLFTLGKDEARVQEVDVQTLEAFVTPEGTSEPTPLTFKAVPQPGDSAGKTSQFVGQLPEELRGQAVSVTLPITIAGDRFRFRFTTVAHEPEPMPKKVVASDEKKLYLTPGGVYTEADIQANGSQTASQKYANFHAAHDMKTKPGDRLCPITDTKANPKCTWIVGGKTYEFCCPPCIDEFVQQAKDHPEQIKKPDEYLKK
jgi:hypothetical protein